MKAMKQPNDHRVVGYHLDLLLGRANLVTIAHLDPSEEESTQIVVRALIKGKRERWCQCSAASLEQALVRITATEATKRCGGPCGLEKPLGLFPVKPASRDGRAGRCKVCERERHKSRGYNLRKNRKSRRNTFEEPD